MRRASTPMRIRVTIVLAAIASSAIGVAQAEDCPPHPYPCGNEWPAGLEGPFELREVRYVKVPSFDGTLLEGWIGFPDVPGGVRVPVALHSSPYLGFCYAAIAGCTSWPGDPAYWTSEEAGVPPQPAIWQSWTWGVPPIELIRHGYAAAFFSVRGTGNSGGCFELAGHNEQRDHAFLVEWLAGRLPSGEPSPAAAWSNGRVAMGGLSYPGWTTLQAAVGGSSALKTVVVGGIVSDYYTFTHTPQGASFTLSHPFMNQWAAHITAVPPLGRGVQQGVAEHVPVVPERACEEVIRFFTTEWHGFATDTRDGAFYEERRLIDRFDQVTSAALVAHGLRDDEGHAFQDSELWNTMPNAPKRLIEGYWTNAYGSGHTFPTPDVARLDPAWEHDTWDELLFAWLDHWLWGKGPIPERLSRVSYQDHLGSWRESSAWPPAEARDEVLYLSGEAMTGEPTGASRSFRSAPNALNTYRPAAEAGSPLRPWGALCPPAEGTAERTSLIYMSPSLTGPVTLAGNPFGYLRLRSDQPGGFVSMKLIDIGPDFSCSPDGRPTGARFLSGGTADLRFHDGRFEGRDFPVDTPTNVRIDLFDISETLLPGHRLAVEVSFGHPIWDGTGQPYFPEVIVSADGGTLASHLVLPVVNGTLGGAAPTIDYPPRPFVPVR